MVETQLCKLRGTSDKNEKRSEYDRWDMVYYQLRTLQKLRDIVRHAHWASFFYINKRKTSAVSATDLMVVTQLCMLCCVIHHDTFVGRAYSTSHHFL